MIQVDGKEIDFTKPETWGESVKFTDKDSSIVVVKDGVKTVVTPQKEEPNA